MIATKPGSEAAVERVKTGLRKILGNGQPSSLNLTRDRSAEIQGMLKTLLEAGYLTQFGFVPDLP